MATVDIRINGVATPNESLSIGDTVTLTNADNTGITVFEWQIVSKPTGSTASLVGANTDTATFIVDVEGAYLVRLLANSGLPGTVDGLAVARVVTVHLGLKPLAKGETSEGDAAQGWAKAWREAYLTLDKAVGIPADRRTFYYNGSATTGPVVLAPTGGVAVMDNGDIVPTMTLATPATPPGLRVLFESGSLTQGFVSALTQGLSGSLSISPVPSAGTAFYVGAAGALTTTPSDAPPVGYAVSGSGARLLFSASGAVAYGSVSGVGTVTSDGTSAAVARADHVHAHGDQGGGTLHAGATGLVSGFMSGSDKAKLDLVDPARIPTSDEKAALTGTDGAPSLGNPYVTDSDSRMTDARTPTGTASGDLSGTYPAPSVVALQGTALGISTTPVSGQVLSWNGSAWVPASPAAAGGGSGGGGVILYLNEATSAQAPTTNIPLSHNGLVTVKALSITDEATQSVITSSNLSTSSYDVVCGFVTAVNYPGVTSVPAGVWDFNVWVSASGGTTNQTLFRIGVYKYDGANAPTLIANSDDVYIYDPTVTAQYIVGVVIPASTTLLATDRIYVQLEAKGTTNNRTVTFSFGNGTPTHVHTTIPSVAGTGIVHVVNGVFQSPASPVNLQGGATEVSGVLPIVSGGTAVSTTPTNGQLLIGNGTGYSQAALTGTNGVVVTNGSGTITLEVGTIAQSQVASLPADLAARALDATVVHLAGTETITGTKTFSANVTVPALPVSTTHATSKAYVDGLVTGLAGFYAPAVQNLTALRAVVSAERADKQLRLVEDENSIYRYDAQGTGTDDNSATIQPGDAGALGRWFKVSAVTQNHESLTGLLGGASNDHYHLTSAQLSVLTGATSSNTGGTLVLRDVSGNFSANVVTATLSGNASSSSSAAITNDIVTNATYYPTFVNFTSGNQIVKTSGSKLTYNPSTGTLAATAFSGSGASLTSIPNSATTATSVNTASAIVARDASGNFTAGTVTATTFSGSGASLTSIPNSATTATSVNTAGAIVARDASGNFAAGTITATTFSGSGASLTGIPQSAVTSLSADLSARPTGSGTATRVAFWSGASALSSNANLYWDNTNSRLGLGTASPNTALQINATGITGAGILLYNSDTSSASVFYEARGRRSDTNASQSFSGGIALAGLHTGGAVPSGKHLGTIYFGGNHTNNNELNLGYTASISGVADGAFASNVSSPTALVFYTGATPRALGTANVTYGTERLRITSTGLVGIGNVLPNYNLHLHSGSANTAVYSQYTNGSTLSTASDGFVIGLNASNEAVLNMQESASMRFYTAGSERVSISSGGAVAINAPTAGTPLTVTAAALSSTLGSTSPSISLSTSTIGNTGYLSVFARRFAAGSDWTSASTRIQHVTDVTAQGFIDFNPEGSASTIAIGRGTTENVRIQANGDVGIGITPVARFHVYEPSLTAPSLTWGADAAAIIRNEAGELAIGHNTAGPYNLWLQGRTDASGTKDIALQPSGGSVSVGTINVLKKFNVNGQIGMPYGNAICFTNGTSAAYTADVAMYNYWDGSSDVLLLQASGASGGVISLRAGAAAAYRAEQVRVSSATTQINNVLNATQGVLYPDGDTQIVSADRMFQPKNFIINGNFDFWQRWNTGIAPATDGAGTRYFGPDRWYLAISGGAGTVTVAKDTSLTNGVQACKVTRSSVDTTTTSRYLVQEIDREYVRLARGRVLRVTCMFKTGTTFNGTLDVEIIYNTDVSTAQTVQAFTLPWSTIAYVSPTTALAERMTSSPQTSWLSFTAATSAVIPTGATNMCLRFKHTPTVTASADNFFSVASVMLTDAGSDTANPTPVPSVPYVYSGGSYAGELLECQRYYEKSYAIDTNPGTTTVSAAEISFAINGTIAAASPWPLGAHPRFKVTKRLGSIATTRVGLYSTDGTSGVWNVGGTAFVGAGIANYATAAGATSVGIVLVCAINPSQAINTGYASGHWTVDAEI